jgi:CRISPR/Cas system-associated exonuclease Cas4 (RecB family)
LKNGVPFFNGPPSITPPERHNPSSLLQCHRKATYQQQNAPEETQAPTGIYWIGSLFESDIIVPFLEKTVVEDNQYVTNSLWVDYTVSTDAGQLRIKGETDPVIVDADAEPLLLTEIKSKRSVENIQSPDTRHRAQAHAYMKGLSEKYDRTVTKATIIYGSRKTLDITAFEIEFDPFFWRDTVLEWAENQTTYRLRDDIPPAEPEQKWECDYCAYTHRCGKSNREFSDVGPTGLLPRFTGYPRPKLVDYLTTYKHAKLTPSLAYAYPKLAADNDVLDWLCRLCGATYQWDKVEWDRDVTAPPTCPGCSDDGRTGLLSGPNPADQPAEVSR